jgi:aryl-alcohol dehydrogenase-like predicted oxidoreductase
MGQIAKSDGRIREMETRRIGTSGLEVSALGLGCNNFGGRLDRQASIRVIHAAIDLGVTLIDTADIYSTGASEEIIGEALAGRRGDVVLATKFGMEMDDTGRHQGGSRRWIVEATEASLRRLKTDRIDLYQFHRPDPKTPIEETVRALDDLIRQGKVLYVGCSNFAAWQTVEALFVQRELGLDRFICAQEEYSLVVRDIEREVVPALDAYGLGLLPFFPLACGLLTGKYHAGKPAPNDGRLAYTQRLADRFMSDRNMALVERYRAFAEERGHTLLDLAFAWLLARKTVPSVIAGASTAEQLAANAEAVTWTLSAEDLAEIDAIAADAAA